MINNQIIQIGHRGLMGSYPQNTLESFRAALDAGLKMIELDVVLSKDKKLVVFHDSTVDNITSGQFQGLIESFSFNELREMNVHDNRGEKDKIYQIPTLDEVLNVVGSKKPKAKVNIELKGENTAKPTAEIINKYLNKGYKTNDFVISSFRHNELVKFKKIHSSIQIAMLFDNQQWKKEFKQNSELVLNKAIRIKASAINPGKDFINQELVDAAHKHNLKVNVWTIVNKKEFARMKNLGVDGVFVNYQGLES